MYLEHDLDELRLVILSKLPQDQLADVLEIYHTLLLNLTRKIENCGVCILIFVRFNVLRDTGFNMKDYKI